MLEGAWTIRHREPREIMRPPTWSCENKLVLTNQYKLDWTVEVPATKLIGWDGRNRSLGKLIAQLKVHHESKCSREF